MDPHAAWLLLRGIKREDIELSGTGRPARNDPGNAAAPSACT